jgi:hypothetical protein
MKSYSTSIMESLFELIRIPWSCQMRRKKLDRPHQKKLLLSKNFGSSVE